MDTVTRYTVPLCHAPLEKLFHFIVRQTAHEQSDLQRTISLSWRVYKLNWSTVHNKMTCSLVVRLLFASFAFCKCVARDNRDLLNDNMHLQRVQKWRRMNVHYNKMKIFHSILNKENKKCWKESGGDNVYFAQSPGLDIQTPWIQYETYR